jgi:hypothetical protein
MGRDRRLDSGAGGPYALDVARGAVPRIAGRVWPGLALALSLVGLATTGCFHYARSQTFASSGSCTGACDHYLDCKQSDSEDARDECLEECRQIFVYQGEPDRASLQDFEELDCEATIAFVDGDGGQRPRIDEKGVRRSQTQR